MPWCVRRSYVLDRLLGVQLARDVDVCWEIERPSEAEVREALQIPAELSVDYQEVGLDRKFNTDLLMMLPDGRIVNENEPDCDAARPSVISAITSLNCDDCMRVLKTGFKYSGHLSIEPSLRDEIVVVLQDYVSEEMTSSIQEALLRYITQDRVYMALRNYLTETCEIAISGEDCPVLDGLENVRFEC